MTTAAAVTARLHAAIAAAFAQLPAGAALGVGFSGGADSTALLALAAAAAPGLGARITALHINHQLHPEATSWQRHCAAVAQRLGCAFATTDVVVAAAGAGTEAAARAARYDALARLCADHRLDALWLAHHQDDQAETVLLSLLRGSGAAGLAAMPAQSQLPQTTIRCQRPLLDWPRSALVAYLRDAGLDWIDDPSNADLRHPRNAIRHQVLPALRAHDPGAAARLARSAQLLGQTQQLLAEWATLDLERCDANADDLDAVALQALGPARAANALRAWLGRAGLRMPSQARLDAWLAQLDAPDDRMLAWPHDGIVLRRWRGRLHRVRPLVELVGAQTLDWNGQDRWEFPGIGVIHFNSAAAGPQTVAEAVLRAAPLVAQPRCGGERWSAGPGRPARSVKRACQEAGVPPWQRSAPVLWQGDALLWVPALGLDGRLPAVGGSPARRLVWEPAR